MNPPTLWLFVFGCTVALSLSLLVFADEGVRLWYSRKLSSGPKPPRSDGGLEPRDDSHNE